MGESPLTISVHGLTLAGILGIFAILFKQHKIWVRMKDRIDALWQDFCEAHDIPYKPIENGKSGD
jgi:hypothetical protein